MKKTTESPAVGGGGSGVLFRELKWCEPGEVEGPTKTKNGPSRGGAGGEG